MNRVVACLAAITLGLLVVASVAVRGATDQVPVAVPPAPAQPLPYSHHLHVSDLGLDCRDCHVNPDHGKLMTYPASSVCASCHRTMPATRPALQHLAALMNAPTPIPWVRVYQLPDFVYWSHGPHLAAGVACEECHGPVADRDVTAQETDVTTMRGCQRCHEKRQVFTDCGDCHEPRQ